MYAPGPFTRRDERKTSIDTRPDITTSILYKTIEIQHKLNINCPNGKFCNPPSLIIGLLARDIWKFEAEPGGSDIDGLTDY